MIYRYLKIVTEGVNGTTIIHQSTEENNVQILGEIDGYTYISTDNLGIQNETLVFEEVELTDEQLTELKKQRYLKHLKATVRKECRDMIDIEDDLINLKKIVMLMGRGFAGLWASIPEEQKTLNPYKDNFDLFQTAITDANLRLDLEGDSTAQAEEVARLLAIEEEFTDIVDSGYFSKIK